MAYYTSSSGQPLYSGYSSPASSNQLPAPINYTPANANSTSASTGLPMVYPNQGSVLGATTEQSSSNQQQSSGGVPSGGIPNVNGYLNEFGNWVPIDQNANAILDQGYNDYFASLDAQLSGLGTQKTAQEQIANNTFNQGMNTVGSQYAQGQQDLSTNRQKTLRDLSDNLIQSFKQGNTYLGTRGASDSSAANQYSYALTKLGNKNRGDIQGQYDQNLFKLKNTYNTETKNLELSKNSQLQQISQWFAEAQNALQGQKGQAALQKSQQALSMAMQMAQQVQQETANRRALLDQWAANHAQSFQQLQGQLAQNAAFSVNAPNSFSLAGGQGGFTGVAAGYGSPEDKKKGIFGY